MGSSRSTAQIHLSRNRRLTSLGVDQSAWDMLLPAISPELDGVETLPFFV